MGNGGRYYKIVNENDLPEVPPIFRFAINAGLDPDSYGDATGTATIGTDLKIYMSANNGTNFTEAASYSTAQTFSGSIKMVRLGKTTVTSGTQVKLKAVWANQAPGSKVTRLNGWAINY